MNLTLSNLSTTHSQQFHGLITKLLHEALYLEESDEIELNQNEPFEAPFELEEKSDQDSFIQKFLSPFF